MSRKHDDTVQTAMIFFGLFIKLLGILGSFFLWLFRKFREDKRQKLEAQSIEVVAPVDERQEAALARLMSILDADLMEEEAAPQLEYQSAE